MLKDNKMKALVVYGTRWGGTAGVGQKIAEVLRKEGNAADVADAKQTPRDLTSYDLFIVGSGIRADKWTDETLRFLQKNILLLRRKKTALFVSCQMADRKDELGSKAKIKYLQGTAEKYGLQPVAYGFFGGYLDFHQSHGLIVDIMMKVNRKKLRRNGLDQSKTLDTRSWEKIEAWASEIANLACDEK